MSIEIKFRGFSEELKCFVYGFYQEVEAEGVGYSYIFWQGHTTYVRADSVSQFTGQYDLNLQEIYKSDIIAYSRREKQGNESIRIVNEKGHEVEYKNGCFFLNNEPLGYEWEEDKFVEYDTQKWATVIGNVFQNSNLLTK